jgi:hypothetical protein
MTGCEEVAAMFGVTLKSGKRSKGSRPGGEDRSSSSR